MKEHIIIGILVSAFVIIIYASTQWEKAKIKKLKQSSREEVMREVVGRGYAEWVVDSNSVVGIKWK